MNFLSKLFNRKKKEGSIVKIWVHNMVHNMEKDAVQIGDQCFPTINRKNTFIQIIQALCIFYEGDKRFTELRIDYDAFIFELGTFNLWCLHQWLDSYLPNEKAEIVMQPFVFDFLEFFSRAFQKTDCLGGPSKSIINIYNQRIKLFDDLMNSDSAETNVNAEAVYSAITQLISTTQGKELIDNFHFTETNDNTEIKSLIKFWAVISLPNVCFKTYCEKFYEGYVFLFD